MSYRAEIQARAREAAEPARDEVLHAELRGLENLLAFCRAEPIPDKQQIDDSAARSNGCAASMRSLTARFRKRDET